MFEVEEVLDATAAKCAAISGVCICGYLEATPLSWLRFDSCEVDGSATKADGGDEELLIVVVKFCMAFVHDVDELRCVTAIKEYKNNAT